MSEDFLRDLNRALTEAIENTGEARATTGPTIFVGGRWARLRFRLSWWSVTRRARRGKIRLPE